MYKTHFFNRFFSFNTNLGYGNHRRLFFGNLPGMFLFIAVVIFSARYYSSFYDSKNCYINMLRSSIELLGNSKFKSFMHGFLRSFTKSLNSNFNTQNFLRVKQSPIFDRSQIPIRTKTRPIETGN